MMGFTKTIYYRVASDYFAKDRMSEYIKLLKHAINNGYSLMTLKDYFLNLRQLPPYVIIIRHDIDTDPVKARMFYEVEKSLGTVGSYYFRLATLDFNLMKEIELWGGEASYHFEEIATYAKENKIHNVESLRENIEQIQLKFIKNYLNIKYSTKLPMLSVASHGDFVNRKLKMVNYELLNQSIREQCEIIVEAYDSCLKDTSISISDTLAPKYWRPFSPLDAVDNKEHVIYLLTHPRHWGANWIVNTKDNANRLYEGVRFRIM